jgi:hypothetical protein
LDVTEHRLPKGGIIISPRSKRDYREAFHLRYKNTTRPEKTAILDEFCATCGCHHKHAISVLSSFKRFTQPKANKRGNPSVYQKEEISKPLKEIWLAANLPCSKRLKVILPIWLPGYVELFGELSTGITDALLRISPPTIDMILKPIRFHYTKRGRSTTKPRTLLRKQIPIKTNRWDESRPGFLEADTVAHCGESTAGMFANTIDFVDIATGWTEQRAVWGKGETGVLEQIKNIEKTSRPPSSASITITEASSSTITSSDTSPKENNLSSSPEAELTTNTNGAATTA